VLVDLGEVALNLHLFADDGEISAAPELDSVAASFRTLRDPMAHIRDWAREGYADRIAQTKARLADPSRRDFLDETIEEIDAGLGRRALARRHEI
ncbi:hypothetical protein, partial [Nocardia cyriacigeorgica]|uniref:hypothetical protein n=1 Tax=Nocardia cyriacigeorgica TaxID=135487 RepID=UPI001895650D